MKKENRYSKIKDLLDGLDCPIDYESSCKMTRGHLGTERFLVGIDLHRCPRTRVLTLARKLRMPESLFGALERGLPQANKAGVGFEQRPHSDVIKIYLEYWERLAEGVRNGRHTKGKPVVLYEGFKWTVDTPGQAVLHRYQCLPLLSVDEVLQHVSAMHTRPDHDPVRNTVCRLIQAAGGALQRDSFIYTELVDPQSGRRSYDVNLYKSGLRLGDVASHLQSIGDGLGVSHTDLETLLAARRHCRLGHLSGGALSTSAGFVTFYYEVDDL